MAEAWEGMEIETIFAYLIGCKLTLSSFSIFSSPTGLTLSSRDNTRDFVYVPVDSVGDQSSRLHPVPSAEPGMPL